jgi:xanthine dehydrogenase YagR molybdenum-binding subunit
MTLVGQGIPRTDGLDKACGRASYAGDVSLPGMVYGHVVLSTVAKGRIAAMNLQGAQAMPGVLAIITHHNAQRLPQGGKAAVNPPAGRVLSLLQDDQVSYSNQPVAVIVATRLDQAREAARTLALRYEAAGDAITDFDRAKAGAHKPEKVQQGDADSQRGDLAAGQRAAQARVDVLYTTPVEHHNPMEPHATVAAWQGDQLTLYDSTQYVSGDAQTVAKTLGIAPEKVTVLCPFVGGGFGCKGSSWSHVVLAAMAARQVGRPVKIVLDRTQMFGPVGNRPHTEQALSLGADMSGQLTAMKHAVISETSVIEDWTEPSALVTRMLYACPNQSTSHRLAKMNVGTPTFMRAPGEASGSFALEAAMDELAYALKMDPLQLRLKNHAEQDPEKNKPFSSKSLRACYLQAAERFGWQRRNPVPGRMRDGRWRVGWGMATATYPTNRSQAAAEVLWMPDGRAVVRSGTQDLGTGAYTVMTQVAADALGLPVASLRFELGDSRMPKAPVSGGSQSTASVSPAVQAACDQARQQVIDLALGQAASPLKGLRREEVLAADGWLRARTDAARGEPIAKVLGRHGQMLRASAEAKPGAEKQAYSMHGFGAVFVEVRIDEMLGILRVPRIVAAYGVGKLLNAQTAHSQLMGGIVWGLGMALFEETVRDARNGRYVNASLAEYHVPVNADVQHIDVIVVPEDDPHVNPLGVKGIGEIGITGVAGAVGNAVYHATGLRVRDLPITLDKLLMAWA